jgi:hypothetical protein
MTIPRHNPIKAFTMGGIIRDAGLTGEEFHALQWTRASEIRPLARAADGRHYTPSFACASLCA